MWKADNMFALLFLAALAFIRRKVEWGAGWVWPMPRIRVDGKLYPPFISSGIGEPRPGGKIHAGVDIVYRRENATDQLDRFPVGKNTGTRGTFAPPVPVIAAKDGVVWSAGLTPTGWSVVIDHGKPFATYYTHMSSLLLPAHAKGVNTATGKPTPIKAGDIIGLVGASPMDPERVPHLHFEVWEGGTHENAVDPEGVMPQWPLVSWVYKVPR